VQLPCKHQPLALCIDLGRIVPHTSAGSAPTHTKQSKSSQPTVFAREFLNSGVSCKCIKRVPSTHPLKSRGDVLRLHILRDSSSQAMCPVPQCPLSASSLLCTHLHTGRQCKGVMPCPKGLRSNDGRRASGFSWAVVAFEGQFRTQACPRATTGGTAWKTSRRTLARGRRVGSASQARRVLALPEGPGKTASRQCSLSRERGLCVAACRWRLALERGREREREAKVKEFIEQKRIVFQKARAEGCEELVSSATWVLS
jgi:hypothetical protein